jgi:quinohemoprotein ethanol dehydrogenase
MTSTPQTRTQARLLAFQLDAHNKLPKTTAPVFPKPPRPMYSDSLAKKGQDLFEKVGCAFCHGHFVESAGGAIKDLRYASASTHDAFAGIVMGGLRKDKGMPVIPGLSIEDVNAIQAYVINRAWEGYNESQKQTKASKK